ncbi:hypothetical protein KR222_002284, partial [Zaprionus bogoriensis]
FNCTPLAELSVETRRQLAGMLNRKKVLRTEEGYEGDWRGIAKLAGLRPHLGDDVHMPMDSVLNMWIEHSPGTAKVGNLERFLGIIDRWDVSDDIQENLLKDTDRYKRKLQLQKTLLRNSPPPKLKCPERNNNNHMGLPVNILSIDDEKCLERGEPLPNYTACVLYAEADIEHATDIMKNLEAPPYNLKLFLRHRDLLMGVPFEHVELAEFMSTRCSYLIVVMTQEFLKSPEIIYLVNFTQKLQIGECGNTYSILHQYYANLVPAAENHMRKIIPILFENIQIPKTLAVYTHVSYVQHSSLFNFWDRLARSLQDVDVSSASIYSAPVAVETPRIMLNGADVTDLPDCKLRETEPKPELKPKQQAARQEHQETLPELKVKRKEKFRDRILPFRNSGLGKPLTHAKSFSVINVKEHDKTLDASISNLSTHSEKKKGFKAFGSKLFKTGPFARSTTKLQAPC